MKRLAVLFSTLFTVLVFALSGVNLNSATSAELENLPGVGKKLAEQIVAARPFKTVDDLKNVKGIGDAKFAKLKNLVSVDGTTTTTTTSASTTAPVTAPVTAPAAPSMSTNTAPIQASASAAASTSKAKMAAGTRINVNTASVDELAKLPGIGKHKAEAIIAARPFATPEDLMKVKGIKQGVFAKLKDHVTVN